MLTMRDITEGLPRTVRDALTSTYKAGGGSFAAFGEAQKRAMAQAVFVVEDRLEHQQGNVPPSKRTVVNELRRRRNLLLDELGENETPRGRWVRGRWVAS